MTLLTVTEVAERVKLDETTVRRAIRRGELRAAKICRQIRVRDTDLEEWFEENLVEPAVDIPRAPAPRAPRAVPSPAGTSRGSFRDKVRQQRGAA
ncbi:MAG: Helix-turn-helix domain [Acidimicrobiales bacterium]|nr:Helix-turn-helix domain [Acidimicrobiales bacterium]